MRTDGHGRDRAIWLTAIVIAIAARTVALGRWPGVNGDESWYGVNVQELLAGGTPFLHTGVGNPLNPLHSGLLLALSTVLPASAALLRLPEVILGLAAVVAARPLLSGALGARAALLVTVMLAMSPTAVAYSRIGWDPSGTPLMTLLALGAALADRPIAAGLAVAVGYLVHPTNVFVAPMVVCAWAPHALRRYCEAGSEQRARLVRLAGAATVVAIPAAAWALFRIAGNPDTPLPSIRIALERALSPALWATRVWDSGPENGRSVNK